MKKYEKKNVEYIYYSLYGLKLSVMSMQSCSRCVYVLVRFFCAHVLYALIRNVN